MKNCFKSYLLYGTQHVFTYVVFVGLQGPLQRDRQLLIDLVHSCLDFHLNGSFCCFDTVLPKRCQRLKHKVELIPALTASLPTAV